MNPVDLTAENLVMDWINSNTKYTASKGAGGPSSAAGSSIRIIGHRQIAWVYLELSKRWNVEPGLYFLTDIGGIEWKGHKLPPIGDPGYFKTLTDLLENEPKPF